MGYFKREGKSDSRDSPRFERGGSRGKRGASRDAPWSGKRAYGDRDDDRGSRSFGGRFGGREDRQMHTVTCASCGEDCEVPFKPTGNKPVYCTRCFKKGARSESSESSSPSGADQSQQFEELNRKLDMILALLRDR